jgi:hypothetical protein
MMAETGQRDLLLARVHDQFGRDGRPRSSATASRRRSCWPGYTDEYLAVCWHAAQHNPAPHGDYQAGQLAEQIGREIIRRWLGGVAPELWHHQGRDHTWKEQFRLGVYFAFLRAAP